MSPRDEPIPATERILGGFCHDLNGQLANAAGFLYLLDPGPDEETPGEADAEAPRAQLVAALERMEELVRQLRWLARGEGGGPEPVSTADLVGALRALLPRLPRFHNAAIEQFGPDDLPATRVDFHAALRALLTAIDAGTPGGVVRRVGVVVEVEDEGIRIGPEAPGLHGGREALDVETTRAGLTWNGGDDGAPLRVQLPRL